MLQNYVMVGDFAQLDDEDREKNTFILLKTRITKLKVVQYLKLRALETDRSGFDSSLSFLLTALLPETSKP